MMIGTSKLFAYNCGVNSRAWLVSTTMAGFLVSPQSLDSGDNLSFISVDSVHPGPDTLTSEVLWYETQSLTNSAALELIRRLRALTLALLPVEVSPSSINEPTSRIITPQVISAYRAAAGDFRDAVSSVRCLYSSTNDIPC
jgi:hypothetical protein